MTPPAGEEKSLLAFLDAEPWQSFLALADLAEEQGDNHLARAWRWLARRRKYPEYRDGLYRWARSNKGGEWEKMKESSWRLPEGPYRELWHGTDRPDPASLWGVIRQKGVAFERCSDALAAVAKILADASRRGFDIDDQDFW